MYFKACKYEYNMSLFTTVDDFNRKLVISPGYYLCTKRICYMKNEDKSSYLINYINDELYLVNYGDYYW